MTLAQLIRRDIDDIVDEWEQFARTTIAPAQDLSPEELRDHARVLLLAVAADLQTAQGEVDQRDKSRGELPDNAPRITETAHEHAEHRFEQRFTLDQMLSEIRALRASVLRRWVDECTHFDRAAVLGQIRFGEAMDQALTESVAMFGAKVDESRRLLLGVLGHDIRTPLGAIRMSAQLLERTQGLDDRQSKAVQRILSSSNSMRTMVDDILDFTQTSLGMRLPITRADCDLRAVCSDVVAELEALHPQRRIELECVGDLAGKWDAGRTGQMLSNLVRNAIQHGDPALAVTVTVQGAPDDVTIAVHNAGSPVPPRLRETLFEPLAQSKDVGGNRHAGSSGLGLGLYIARQIAVAHGGSIEVVSSEQDGTTFIARLHR
jgi:signal transduction histidine kinase